MDDFETIMGKFRGVNSFALLAAPLFERWNELLMEHLRAQYHLARMIYAMRHDAPKTTGENVLTGKLIPMGDYSDWKGFFYELYNHDLDDYVKAARREGLSQEIRKYEISQYGSSTIPEAKTEETTAA